MAYDATTPNPNYEMQARKQCKKAWLVSLVSSACGEGLSSSLSTQA